MTIIQFIKLTLKLLLFIILPILVILILIWLWYYNNHTTLNLKNFHSLSKSDSYRGNALLHRQNNPNKIFSYE